MIRQILIAAWRNMAANRLTSAAAILSLEAGIAAVLAAVAGDALVTARQKPVLALRYE